MRAIRHSDSGVSLVLVLIIVTVIAVVTGAIISQATSSVRATVGLRTEAGSDYAADAAGQVAVNTLRQGTFSNGSSQTGCFGATYTLSSMTVPYPATNGLNGTSAGSAYVTCSAEAGTGSQGSPVPITNANKPGQAILTLSTSGAETGQTYGQSNKPIYIRGAITSDSTIDSTKAQLNVIGSVPISAVGACTGTFNPVCTHPAAPGTPDPGTVPPPSTPAPPTSLPPCNNKNKVADFLPGLYKSEDTFNTCKASWIYLHTGTYFFDFAGSSGGVWTIGGGACGCPVVGGTLSAAESDTAPATPGACVNPINSQSAVGVTLVMGGQSQISFAAGSSAEFCATYAGWAGNAIPTVLYGLKSNVGSGSNVVHAESGCVVTVGGCNVVSDPGNGTKPVFFFEGFAYVPLASINLAVNNSSQPYFNFGIISRTLTFTTTGSACTPPACPPFISLPDNSPGFGTASTIVDLNVYVCPGSSTCSASGKLQLTARVQIFDPTGTVTAGARQMKILSWSQQR